MPVGLAQFRFFGQADTLSLIWLSGPTVLDPAFGVTFSGALVGDVMTLQIDNNSDFSSLHGSSANTLDASEAATGAAFFSSFTTLSVGVTYYARVVHVRAAATLGYSNTAAQTITPPVTGATPTYYFLGF
jgi:hypothetical protein